MAIFTVFDSYRVVIKYRKITKFNKYCIRYKEVNDTVTQTMILDGCKEYDKYVKWYRLVYGI